MASSVDSATPAPPARIRVVAHPPLPPLRAWLPLPSTTPQGGLPTVSELVEVVRGMLGVEGELSVELQGFALLPNSPVTMLDTTNDILDIKLASPTDFKPEVPAPAALAARIPLPPSPSRHSRRSSSRSSSSSSSSSSSDSDSDSDAPPETASTKRPLVNGHAADVANGVERPAKRARTASPSPSSSDSSSSSSSDSSSDSDSDSSSSSSDSDSSATSTSRPLSLLHPKSASNGVPPGRGLRRTKKRNQRKRKLRSARAREGREQREAKRLAKEKTKDEGGGEEDMEVDGDTEIDEPAAVPSKPTIFDSVPPPPSVPVPPTPPAAPASLPSDIVSPASRPPADSPSVFLSTGGEPGVSLVGAGFHAQNLSASSSMPSSNQKNKKKKRKQHQQQQQEADQSFGFFDAPQPAIPGAAGVGVRPGQESPEWRPVSPDLPSSAYAEPAPSAAPPVAPVQTPSRPAGRKSKDRDTGTPRTPRPPVFLVPSKRRDLPPNMVVTRVNVEAKGWEPGVGRLVEGTGREWVAPVTVLALEDDGEEVEEGGEMGREEVEKRWDGLRKLEKGGAKEGMKVAVKILELDPSTFAPSLSLKYGTLLPPSSASSLRIQVDPSCLPPPADDEAEEEYYAEEEEEEDFYGASLRRKKMRFGEDLVAAQEDGAHDGAEDGLWEGEWDGADVRAVSLR